MPTFRNVSPMGGLELVLHAQLDADGQVIDHPRFVFLEPGETFEVTDAEATLIDDQPANFQLVEGKTK